MQTTAEGAAPPVAAEAILPVQVRLKATENGELAAVYWYDQRLETIKDLRTRARALVESDDAVKENGEVVLECAQRLKYSYVIDAVTALSGYRDVDGRIVPLLPRIRFALPRSE